MVDDAVLGICGWVIGRIGAGIPVGVGCGPDETDDPGDECPAQEEVDGEDAAGAGVASHHRDDGGKEIEDKADAAEWESEWTAKEVERIE